MLLICDEVDLRKMKTHLPMMIAKAQCIILLNELKVLWVWREWQQIWNGGVHTKSILGLIFISMLWIASRKTNVINCWSKVEALKKAILQMSCWNFSIKAFVPGFITTYDAIHMFYADSIWKILWAEAVYWLQDSMNMRQCTFLAFSNCCMGLKVWN